MKKYLLLLLLCVASANLMAQSIPSDSKWYDGWNNYVASDWDEGSVLMQVIAEGEKLEFILVPVEGEKDCYILEKSPDADAVLSYPVGLVVKRARGDGLEVLCLFDGNDRLTLHRTMGKCLMDFKGDLKGEPQWWQQWDQSYLINAKGHFVLLGQQVVAEKGKVDQYAVMDFKTWDMLVCSRHDMDIMDTWNEYSLLVNSTYDPDYQYNPFPWDVVQLYHMNPQRFLTWMAAHRDQGNRLLPLFKLPPRDRPALLKEIGRLDDPATRQWLTALVNNWDDKPLTKHL